MKPDPISPTRSERCSAIRFDPAPAACKLPASLATGKGTMRLSVIILALLAAFLSTPVPALAQPLVLERAVILMRHGVRPPTNTRELAPLAADPWPTWDVPDGQLTPHGAAAVAQLGRWLRHHFAAAGLVAPDSLPRRCEPFVWSDARQRAPVHTAAAFGAGPHPAC